jgi:hypothetical protein
VKEEEERNQRLNNKRERKFNLKKKSKTHASTHCCVE